MATQNLSSAARHIESLLSGEDSDLLKFLRQEAGRQVEAKSSVPSNYDVFAIRRNDQLGDEIFGPKRLHVGTYSEEVLYGAAGSPVARFRSAIQSLRIRVEKAATANPEEVEYGHEVALVWAEVGRLKEFMAASPVISEIVAELRTARFQFLGKDTPPAAMQAIMSALGLVAEAKRLDTLLVDRVVEALEAVGIDSLGPDVLRD